jgi:hypothetical protein
VEAVDGEIDGTDEVDDFDDLPELERSSR